MAPSQLSLVVVGEDAREPDGLRSIGVVERRHPFRETVEQRGGVGEFKLYDPVSDGPARLLLNQREITDEMDYETLYDKIRDIQPTLAEIARLPVIVEPVSDTRASPPDRIRLRIKAQPFSG